MKDEENKMQSAAPEQQAQPEQTQPESKPAADAAQPGTENEPKAETTAPETPDKKKRPLWLKLLAVFAAALAVLGYSTQEVQMALKGVDVENLPLEEIIRQGLKKMVK